MLIDDDAVDRKTVRRALQSNGGASFEIEEAKDAATARALLYGEIFDCILLDYRLPDTDGLELLQAIGDSPNAAAPVIMLTGEGNEAVAVAALKNGAADYITKGEMDGDRLSRSIVGAIEKAVLEREFRHMRRQMEEMALYDTLTGLGNRNLFFKQLDHYKAVAERRKGRFALLMIDLDKFKEINDTHGHQAGDAVLEIVGERLRATIRDSDAGFRIGGDEFTVLTNFEVTRKGITRMTERIFEVFSEPMTVGEETLNVGGSIGVAIYPAVATSAQHMVRAADQAMYLAKKAGGGAVFAQATAEATAEAAEDVAEEVAADAPTAHNLSEVD